MSTSAIKSAEGWEGSKEGTGGAGMGQGGDKEGKAQGQKEGSINSKTPFKPRFPVLDSHVLEPAKSLAQV